MNASARQRVLVSTLLPGLALWVLLAIAWLAYAPGLSGSFLFDDWANLPPLGAHGPIDNWHALVTYLLSGIGGPTGRPVAMLSFLLDANNWPAAPEPFKYTNILIHLLNGTLLTWLTFSITNQLGGGRRRAAWIAVLAAGLWLLHPLMVSTTLFVVQRMEMLAATFVLGGLLCYVHGRTRLAAGHTLSAYTWMTTGIAGFGLLAVLSKENGALLPLFVWLLESLVLQHPSSRLRLENPTAGWRWWNRLFIYLPLMLLGAYLLLQMPAMLRSYANVRNFTLGERLLTEARVVVTYLYLLVIPHAQTAGLFNDDIPLSTGLFHPWSTLPAIALLLSLVVVAIRARKRYPLLSFAILFYFGGQLLESTIIPLELYYEHRNYLPAMFLALPLAHWLATSKRLPERSPPLVGAVLLALFAGFTWSRASLWGHPFEQAMVWAKDNPGSPRAQTTLALHLMHRQEFPQAARILEHASRLHPGNMMIDLNLLSARCAMGGISAMEFQNTSRALQRAKVGNRVAYNALSKFIRHYKTAPCHGLGPTRLDQLVSAALDNPHVQDTRGWRRDMMGLRGELRLAQGKPEQALTQFKASLHSAPDPGAALYEAALLGTRNHPGLGVELLDYYDTLPKPAPTGFGIARLRADWLRHTGYYQSEIKRVRRLLEQAHAAAKQRRTRLQKN